MANEEIKNEDEEIKNEDNPRSNIINKIKQMIEQNKDLSKLGQVIGQFLEEDEYTIYDFRDLFIEYVGDKNKDYVETLLEIVDMVKARFVEEIKSQDIVKKQEIMGDLKDCLEHLIYMIDNVVIKYDANEVMHNPQNRPQNMFSTLLDEDVRKYKHKETIFEPIKLADRFTDAYLYICLEESKKGNQPPLIDFTKSKDEIVSQIEGFAKRNFGNFLVFQDYLSIKDDYKKYEIDKTIIGSIEGITSENIDKEIQKVKQQYQKKFKEYQDAEQIYFEERDNISNVLRKFLNFIHQHKEDFSGKEYIDEFCKNIVVDAEHRRFEQICCAEFDKLELALTNDDANSKIFTLKEEDKTGSDSKDEIILTSKIEKFRVDFSKHVKEVYDEMSKFINAKHEKEMLYSEEYTQRSYLENLIVYKKLIESEMAKAAGEIEKL